MIEFILLGETHGVVGSICRSRARRERRRPVSWLVMSVGDGVGFLPKALDEKAFQRIAIAADWMDRRSWCSGGDREGEGRFGGGWDCVP